MLALHRILFPTDYSPCADRAFAHAAFLARRHHATLEVLTVVAPGYVVLPHSYATDGLTRDDRTVRSADVAAVIAGRALYADLVVMGTHGRRGLDRIALGSTTEGVIRRADCPVLAVGQGADVAAPAAVDRILVPVDFSDASGPALALADALAAVYGARVDAVHAVHLPDLPEVYGIGLIAADAYPDVVANASGALAALAAQHVAADRLGTTEARVGTPAATILEAADRLGAGLLVMPTQGRSGLARVALGSVAEAVLRRAPCPVLATPVAGRLPRAAPLPPARAAVPSPPELADVLAAHDI